MSQFVFFFHEYQENGEFSNWFLSDFSEFGVKFNCVEQYMMYKKAMLFGDEVMANKILEETRPVEHKALGKRVRGFNEVIWLKNNRRIVKQGVSLKFFQNKALMDKLLSFEDPHFVEASKYDRIYGIGLSKDHPDAKIPSRWRGENLLGEIITEFYHSVAKS